MTGPRDRLALLRSLSALGPGLLAALLAMVAVASLLPAVTALTLALVVTRTHHLRAGGLGPVVASLIAFAVVLLVGHALDALRGPVYFLAQARIDGAHRAAIARLTATSRAFGALEQRRTQRLIQEARADPQSWIERTPGAGALSQLSGVGSALSLVGSGLVLAHYAWWLVPLLVLPATAVLLLHRRDTLLWYETWRRNSGEALDLRMWSDALVSPSEGKDIRLYGLGDWVLGRMGEHIEATYRPVFTLGGRQLVNEWRPLVLALVPLGVALPVVAAAAAQGRTSAGTAVAVMSAAAAVYRVFAGDPRDLIGGVAGLRALRELREQLDDGPAAPVTGCAPVRSTPGTVRFEQVSFAYPGTHRRVLDGIDLEIRPGELLAVVGLNGAGKSTLIKLLASLYQPDGGRITVDGSDVAQFEPGAWRRRTAIVFQDFVRYHLSAADNVALGNAAVPVDPDALASAARAAGLDSVVSRLPKGWDTPLSRTRTGGVDLSGGQWQQLVLARALYALRTGAWLLVLDEPTAHLDVRTEFEVFQRLAAQRGDASIVLISHRLATVRRADRIVLLDGGRVTESGSHAELMVLGGRYADMFTMQADRFARGGDDRIEEGELT